MNQFFKDIWKGLNATPKYLDSRYFYNEEGDKIFEEIMNSPEYYLTNCELEIFSLQTTALAKVILGFFSDFDLVELGPGNALKSRYLIKELLLSNVDFTYFPIDISTNVIQSLNKELPKEIKGLKMQGLNGDYFEMLSQVKQISSRKKVVLFLGSSIGNITPEKTLDFLNSLRDNMSPGDLLLIGFDLKKDPEVILNAYNDKGGFTRKFNLNLLKRINKELDADFDIDKFVHRPQYDEATGASKSFLVSLRDQQVRIGQAGQVSFTEGEPIFMEISQKYTVPQTDTFAIDSSFKPIAHFFDSRHWFLDALWQVVS
ncbi:MAG: L-histidine N(alpha)-methyltransferase [Taibaiella sp.]|nr:L-histidine N(alpha)-methyltransferase [Taibaiella sp.]